MTESEKSGPPPPSVPGLWQAVASLVPNIVSPELYEQFFLSEGAHLVEQDIASVAATGSRDELAARLVFVKWSLLAAAATRFEASQHLAAKEAKASAAQRVRAHAEKNHQKITDAAVLAQVESDPTYRKAIELELEATQFAQFCGDMRALFRANATQVAARSEGGEEVAAEAFNKRVDKESNE